MTLAQIVLGSLAVWRVTHLLQAEDGPWDLSVRLRRAAGDGFWGRLLDCFYCLSLWVAAPVAGVLAADVTAGVLLWLGLSAGAIAIERLLPPEIDYHEDPVPAVPAAPAGEE